MAILSKQIGWSQEANLIYELIKQTNRLNQILPGNQPSYGVKRVSQMIGWSVESKLYYEWLKQLDKLTQHYGCPDCTTTTSTSTTVTPFQGSLTVNITSNAPLYSPYYGSLVFWIKMFNNDGFPRAFSMGQYPSAYYAVSIEGGTFYLWYNGSIAGAFAMPDPYLNTWLYVQLISDFSGGLSVYINGVNYLSISIAEIPNSLSELYIGSENAPNTSLNGLISDMVWEFNSAITPGVITSPYPVDGNTILGVLRGNDLTAQITDQGLLGLPVTNNNAIYNSGSPYAPGNGGSLQFGT